MASAVASAAKQLNHAAKGAYGTQTKHPSQARAVCLDIAPHLIHSTLMKEVEEWLADGACQVLLATGLTARQRSTMLQSVVKQYGASLYIDEVQQDDNSMALQMIKAPAAPNLEQDPCGSSRTQTVCLKVSPNRTKSVLKQHLKHWCDSGCEVLVVTGLTSEQRSKAHALIQKSYGPDAIHETVRQEDGAKVLRIIKAEQCILAVLRALQSGNLPQEISRQLVESMRQHWAAAEAERARRCKREAEQRRLRRLTCDGCSITADKASLEFYEDMGMLLCPDCAMDVEFDLEDELSDMEGCGCELCGFSGFYY